MTISFPENDTFEKHCREMLSIVEPPQNPPWSHILVVEDQAISWGKVSRINHSSLFTPEAYENRFNELLSQGHSWVNMSAMGVFNDTLIVEIEFPQYKNDVPRNKLSVNYSRSTDESWDLSKRLEITDAK